MISLKQAWFEETNLQQAKNHVSLNKMVFPINQQFLIKVILVICRLPAA